MEDEPKNTTISTRILIYRYCMIITLTQMIILHYQFKEILHLKASKTNLLMSLILESRVLPHYHTIPHFDALKIYSCGKHCKKRRN